jgi:hypothetical protein
MIGVKKIHENRNQIQFSARHFQPMMTAMVLSVLYIGFECNLQLFGSIGGFFDMGITVRWVLKLFFGLSFLSLYALRCWLPHFDYHTGVAMFTRVTNIRLKPEEVEAFEWFIANKAQYGSPKYLDRFLLAMSIAFTIVFLVWTLISPTTFYIGAAVVFIMLGVVAMGVVKKITVLDDELFIRREMLMHWRIIAFFYVATGFFTMLGPVIGWSMTGWILNELSAVCVTAMGYISTAWLLEKSEIFTLPILMDQIATDRDGKSWTERYCEENRLPTFEQMLGDPVAVATFLKHLVWELSVENLFFLSDVMRFKKTFQTEGKVRDLSGFYYDVPHMLARYGYKPEMGFIPYAWAISKAYVDNLSAFYVTSMDEDVRDAILDYLSTLTAEDERLLEGPQLEKLMNIFDPAARHVFALVKQAYARFIRNVKIDLNQLKTRPAPGGAAKKSAGKSTTSTKKGMETHMAMSE